MFGVNLKTLVWIYLLQIDVVYSQKAYTQQCPLDTWETVFSIPSNTVVLPFKVRQEQNVTITRFGRLYVRIIHLLSNTQLATGYVRYLYNMSNIMHGTGYCASKYCEFVGDADDGNFSIRIQHINVNMSGVYIMKDRDTDTIFQCITLYVLEKPTQPVIEVTNAALFYGQRVKLFCQKSMSTTFPSNHTLNLTYSWFNDGHAFQPDRYITYSSNKFMLTLNDVRMSDNERPITCTATEDVVNGLTSDPSEPVYLTVSCPSAETQGGDNTVIGVLATMASLEFIVIVILVILIRKSKTSCQLWTHLKRSLKLPQMGTRANQSSQRGEQQNNQISSITSSDDHLTMTNLERETYTDLQFRQTDQDYEPLRRDQRQETYANISVG